MPVASNHSVVQHFNLPFSEAQVEAWAKEQIKVLPAEPTFGLLFCASDGLPYAEEILEIVRIYAHVPTMVGCSGGGLVADSHEFESEGGFCIALYCFPDSRARAVHIPEEALEGDHVATALRSVLGESVNDANAWMLFASSESIGSEAWLPDWDRVTGGRVTIGGFASSDLNAGPTCLFENGRVHQEGAVALSLEGSVTIEPIISQGCRPVGSPWTVTQAENNVIHQIGNRPILEVLRDTLEGMSRQDQKQARGNIFIGLVMDEYKPSFGTGDFLVRNLAAIDPKTGAVAIATPLRIGQNLQFQIRDPNTASVDLEELLKKRIDELNGRRIYGACLCDCIGRGSSLFGVPDHDVSVIRDLMPGLSIGGVFCNGEFAPVNGRTLLHGYAASLALFVQI
jgi:small ligand-binding sensory domain FIST